MKKDILFKEAKVAISITIFIILFMITISLSISKFPISKFSLDKFKSYELKNSTINYGEEELIKIEGERVAKVYNVNTSKIENIDIEEYIKGVVASEMQANFNEEALKAQAVAARTYYYSKRIEHCSQGNGAEICNSTHCQVYQSKAECLAKWEDSKENEYWNKISDAVDETRDEVMTYDNKILKYPQFFATSWGKTESAIDVFASDVPYLKSTDSEGEEVAPKYTSEISISINTLIDTINNKYTNSGITIDNVRSEIKTLSTTEGGAVKDLKIGNEVISGVEFRKMFNLNSANFNITFNENDAIIDCKGYGHGLGMSQWGANAMAKEGKTYKDILKHYYSGIEIKKVDL